MEKIMNFFLGVAATLGLFLLPKLLDVLNFVWLAFLRPPKDLVKSYGSWALVTGATDGIGQALAFQLASKGLNLIILGRNETKLENTKRMLHEEFGDRVEVKSILVDLDVLKRDEIIKAIREGIAGLDVGILINNAGVISGLPNLLHLVSADMTESIVNVNVGALTWATMAVLPSMTKKKRGAIVNIGSAAADVLDCYPLLAVYGASKAYVKHLSKSISSEYKSYGIDVQCQIVLPVATRMVRGMIADTSLLIPSPEVWSESSVRWIGHGGSCVPYWPHYLVTIVTETMIPLWLVNWGIFGYFKQHQPTDKQD